MNATYLDLPTEVDWQKEAKTSTATLGNNERTQGLYKRPLRKILGRKKSSELTTLRVVPIFS